jgi:Serine-pyruvate aminotransferase/archaeal aspartate aminotransferase
MEARWARHAAMAAETWKWAEACVDRNSAELGILAPAGARSPTVSAIVLPERLQGPDVVAAVAKRGFTIGAGYGKLRNRTIRVGHMGDHNVDTLRDCLDACSEAIGALLHEN